MNEDVKVSWLYSLRSGEYKQARARLKRDDSYCCLGLLVHVQNPDVDWESTESFGNGALIHDQGHAKLQNRSYAPMKYNGGLSDDDQRHLAYLNDQKGLSFIQIAAYVEDHY